MKKLRRKADSKEYSIFKGSEDCKNTSEHAKTPMYYTGNTRIIHRRNTHRISPQKSQSGGFHYADFSERAAGSVPVCVNGFKFNIFAGIINQSDCGNVIGKWAVSVDNFGHVAVLMPDDRFQKVFVNIKVLRA